MNSLTDGIYRACLAEALRIYGPASTTVDSGITVSDREAYRLFGPVAESIGKASTSGRPPMSDLEAWEYWRSFAEGAAAPLGPPMTDREAFTLYGPVAW